MHSGSPIPPDTIFGFDKEADALQWIKEKSQGWLADNKKEAAN
jgi:hypothetical protein